MAAVVMLAAAGVGAGAEWDAYPGAGTPIQDAVDGAGAGDTIYVHAGTYVENVDVDKWVTLIGDGADVVTVRAANAFDGIFNVTANWVNISGFTATGAMCGDGIYLYHSDHCDISDNNGSNNEFSGICLWYSSNNTLQSNTANLNNEHGIDLYYSSNNTLTDNIANSNNQEGIKLCKSNSNTLQNNNASNNDEGIWLTSSDNNTLQNNTANSNAHGIGMHYSSNNTLTSNTANLNNERGIWLFSSNNYNALTNNTANLNNEYGIYMSYSNNYNTLMDNNASNNPFCGIVLMNSSNYNTLQRNTASNNSYGIFLHESNNNTLYHNNLLNNAIRNAYDYSGTNQWDSGSEGNYWSDYTGTDTNRNGIGDDPYDIPGGGSVDRYPLTGIRWLPPEITSFRLGINTHWNHWADDLSIYEQKIKGFGIVRDQAWWAGLETTDLTGSEWDHANWDYSYNTKTLCGKDITYQSGLDNLVKLYQDEDSPELLLLLNLKNDNISSFETMTADQYYDYVYHVVERYDRDGVSDMPGLIRPVRYFEVGNEVDYTKTGDSRHGYLSPEDYVETRLIPAYNAAKAANKDAIVMGSGLGMESNLTGGKTGEFNTAYLEAMYGNITANGGSRDNNFYMDKIAIHYYSQNEHSEYFDENIK